jgi:4-hydroxy-3-polyprenylbenzoate decarboxylase
MTHASGPGSDQLVVAMTGASGAPYAIRLLRVLCTQGKTVHLSITPSAVEVLKEELGLKVAIESVDPSTFRLGDVRLVYHHYQDFSAGIASGSFLTGGMVVIPCSMSTLGAIAAGTTTNLITRAADVHLKERRKLILVPRETPLSLIHLENMARVTRAGAVVLPAAPGWYHRPRRLEDLIDFVVARICDQLGISSSLVRRWGAVQQTGSVERTERADDAERGAIDLEETEADPLGES